MKRILYIRSGPYQINLNAYNSQEIGLSKAFEDKGICCDIVYYHSERDFDQVIKKGDKSINIFWRKGFRLLRSGLYPQVLKKDFLKQYDAVIVSEYSQIMSVILSKLHDNVYIYNGPYYNLFKIPFLERIYDALFCKTLNKNVKKIFCKTEMSKEYLEKKGFKNCVAVGVGLDTEKFDNEKIIEPETIELLKKMDGYRNLIYVGSVSKRKNIALLIKAFNIIKSDKQNRDVQFVIIGKDEGGYFEECKKIVEPQTESSIVYKPFIKNSQLKFIYQQADIFLLPSVKEIFGMVLLEAMNFGLPTVASGSAGAKTLIENGVSGVVLDDFSDEKWANAIQELLDSEKKRKFMGNAASELIRKHFTWESIVDKMLEWIEL